MRISRWGIDVDGGAIALFVVWITSGPLATDEAGTLAPTFEQTADALVGDGEEVLLGVGVCMDEMEAARLRGKEAAGAGGKVACELGG